MAWTIDLSAGARKSLGKLDRQAASRITKFLATRVAQLDDPRQLGKPLQAELGDYWSYRVGDYRLICELKDNVLTVLVLQIGHRSDIYR